jgi:hypothetical protein
MAWKYLVSQEVENQRARYWAGLKAQLLAVKLDHQYQSVCNDIDDWNQFWRDVLSLRLGNEDPHEFMKPPSGDFLEALSIEPGTYYAYGRYRLHLLYRRDSAGLEATAVFFYHGNDPLTAMKDFIKGS